MSSVNVNNFPLNDLLGTKFTLLDSIRDAGFLSGNGTGKDFGLGVTDNPEFFFTTYYVPGSPTVPRPYPVKFMWIGSPLGTNDVTDVFNIYAADINPEQFSPGAAPAPDGLATDSWLVNPRLVLSTSQAATDVIAWFDANYPGGATGGVGSTNTGTNTTYGTLAGGTSAVGNISGFDSIDGQFWPIYDYIDNTVLLYFSKKTSNCNTLSIYCYKLTDTEFGSPATSAEFLGGLYAPGWTGLNSNFAPSTVLSSHRFSILSPNRLNVVPTVSGQQNGAFMYSYGVIDTISADHGRAIQASIVTDLHGKPLTPGITLTPGGSTINSFAVAESFYTPDKLGSIFPADSVDSQTPGYMCIYNTPLQIDRRQGTDKTVLSAMQMRVMYYNPASGIAYGADALNVEHSPQTLGTCRGYVTTYPDGKPKFLYANWTTDQYLNMAYEYISIDALSPRKQSKIIWMRPSPLPVQIYSYGKKKMLLKLIESTASGGTAASPNLSANQGIIQINGAPNCDNSNGFSFGFSIFTGDLVHVNQVFSGSSRSTPGGPVTILEVDDLDSWIQLNPQGLGASPGFFVELVD